jgi:hypothetical protein
MSSTRRAALYVGLLFIITFLTSIPAVFLYGGFGPTMDHSGVILGASADTRVHWGALLELILVIANIGTAVILFPILKWENEAAALGYVTARVMESVFISIGTLSLLAILTLHEAAGTTGSYTTVGKSLIAIHDWTFLLGPGFVVGIGNGLLLGYLMYRSGLVPRGMAMLGLIGGPLIILSGIAVLFGVFESGSSPQAIATIPEFLWELSLGVYLTVRGFKRSPVVDLTEAERRVRLDPMHAMAPSA